jgi:hypothetical protein
MDFPKNLYWGVLKKFVKIPIWLKSDYNNVLLEDVHNSLDINQKENPLNKSHRQK